MSNTESQTSENIESSNQKESKPFLSKFSEILYPFSPSITLSTLILISILSFIIRIFSIIRFEIIIHEYDQWFNYRVTEYLPENGAYALWDWYDPESWYPLGRIIGGTLYPGIMFTSFIIYKLLNTLLFPIDITTICVFIPPIFASFTSIASFFLGKEVTGRKECGLLCSLFISIVPGYISRSIAGGYDNEAVAITAMIITFYFFVKAINTGSIFYSVLTSIGYFYMVSSWGGYVFIINLIPLYILFLIIIGRNDIKVYTSYSIFYILGNALAMQIPFVGNLVYKSSEHYLSHGVFAILNCVSFIDFLKNNIKTEEMIERLFSLFIFILTVFCFLGFIYFTYKGYIHFGERIMTLLDPTYASKFIPIVASVAEHNPTSWTDFYFDLQFLLLFAPLGIIFCLTDPTNSKLFIVVFSLCSIYFSSVMIRLLLLSSPALCLLSGIGISELLHFLIQNNKSKTGNTSLIELIMITLLISYLIYQFILHSTFAAAESYSDNEIIEIIDNKDGTKVIMDEFREAYYWLRMNTPQNSKIVSWWDYGYQISGMSHRAVIVDNNTWNTSHIATVGAILAYNEYDSFKICKSLDANYVLILFGGVNGHDDDDINKFLWMVRITHGYYPKVKESNYVSNEYGYSIDESAPEQFLESMIYKLSYYKFDEYPYVEYHEETESEEVIMGYDNVRLSAISKVVKLSLFEEVYTTETWMVRIYKVKDYPNRDSPIESRFFEKKNFVRKGKFLKRPKRF